MNALAEASPLEPVYDQARNNFEHIIGYTSTSQEFVVACKLQRLRTSDLG